MDSGRIRKRRRIQSWLPAPHPCQSSVVVPPRLRSGYRVGEPQGAALLQKPECTWTASRTRSLECVESRLLDKSVIKGDSRELQSSVFNQPSYHLHPAPESRRIIQCRHRSGESDLRRCRHYLLPRWIPRRAVRDSGLQRRIACRPVHLVGLGPAENGHPVERSAGDQPGRHRHYGASG